MTVKELIEEYESDLIYNEKFNEVMNQYLEGTLSAIGKGGTPYTVTNSKQAYAIASNMAKRHVKKYNDVANVNNRLEPNKE